MRAIRTCLSLLPFIGPLFCGQGAFAQSLNVDIGCTISTNPPAAYPGAAEQVGVWSWVQPVAGSTQPLVSLTGGATGVTLEVIGGNGCFFFDNPGTVGGDQDLMDDLQDVGGAGSMSTFKFHGLAPGGYWLYTYAWAPDAAAFRTQVHVNGAVDPDQSVGGAWPGMQRYQETFALHFKVLAGGEDLIVTSTSLVGSGSVNGFQLVFNVCDGRIHEYCTPKVNSAGCVPDISTLGVPSVSAGAGFFVNASNVLCDKTGLLIYSVTGPASVPFFGGTLCMTGPFRRSPIQNSGCTGGAPCGGHYSIDINAFAHSPMADPALLVPGTSVWAQWYSRDPGFVAPNNIGLTNAVRFTMCF
jgi:hypothetical protein